MGEDNEFNTMFVDEARIAVQLAHANIVQVLELGKVDDNLFIAMEYISGRDVRQLLERFRKRGRPMPIRRRAPSSPRSARRSTTRTASAMRAARRWASSTATSLRRTCWSRSRATSS